MRYQWLIVHRTKIAVIALMTAALIVSARSGGPVEAKPTSRARPEPASTSFCISSSPPCFALETVNDNPNACNEITGINDNNTIVGLYYNASNGCPSPASSPSYNDFIANSDPTPPPAPTVPPYTNFVSVSYSGANLALQGLSTGHTNPQFTNVYMVGYWQSSTCGDWCGFQHVNTNWWQIVDPNQGSGKCAVTEVLAINDSRIGVGFYDKNYNGTCVQQAFEYYPNNDLNYTYAYVDLNPPSSGGGNSSVATSVSQLGDVAGYVTQNGETSGWLYSDQSYYTFRCCGAAGSYDTYPEAVNFSQGVAGYYVGTGSHSGIHGFLTLYPENTSPSFFTIDYLNNYTVIRALNTNWFFSGWTEGNGGLFHGFVGACYTGCNVGGRNSTRGRRVQPPSRPLQFHGQ